MPYLVASEYGGQLPGVATFTGSSTPLSLGEVATIIARVSAEIDGAAAAAGYAVPIAPPASGGPTAAYAQLETIAEYGAGWKILRGVFPNMGGPGDKNSLATEYKQAYQDALKALRDGKLALVGAAETSGTEGRELARSFETTHGTIDGHAASPMMSLEREF